MNRAPNPLEPFSLSPVESTQPREWDDAFPTRVVAWNRRRVETSGEATHFVFAFRGGVDIDHGVRRFTLAEGMYASVPGRAVIGGEGSGVIISRVGYDGVLLMGGPIEDKGRLRYIDGCTDSLLLGPPVVGDPCLNHLHIPKGTRQTEHTHPSLRVGIIVRGRGRCITPGRTYPLEPGQVFTIAPDVRHCFHTDADSLDVVVYHPDSDTGPTDLDHPMKNRTIL